MEDASKCCEIWLYTCQHHSIFVDSTKIEKILTCSVKPLEMSHAITPTSGNSHITCNLLY